MNKIQYSIYKKETGSAGGKAKNDVFDILDDLGFVPSYLPSDYRYFRIVQQLFSMRKIKKDVVIIVQYPAVDDRIMRVLEKRLDKSGLSIAIVHDLPSIQGMGGNKMHELDRLSHFDGLIVHNKCMADYIRRLGYCGRVVELELFDYLHDINIPVCEGDGFGDICIAGNLDKSTYVKNLDLINRYNFNLFGINSTMDFSKMSNVEYKGLLNSEEIVYKLEGDYGLVWDGDSIDTCSGVYGEYLKYNNPHKLSLYIAAGKPVITWKHAAISDFVMNEKIGYVVESLYELNDLDLKSEYDTLKRNVLNLKKKIAKGYFLKEAIKKYEIYEQR